MIGETNGYDVLIALFAGIPAAIAAVTGLILVVRTRTPNGAKLGEAAAHAAETSAETNEMVKRAIEEYR